MNYGVNGSALPEGHSAPPLLTDLASWVATRKHGDLGWFDGLYANAIPDSWNPQYTERLKCHAYSFLPLPDGSLLLLLTPYAGAPTPVVLLGSEGERRTVANSLEAFLLAWAQGKTGIDELDDEDGAKGREALGKWLAERHVEAPRAVEFDFQSWLDAGMGAVAMPIVPPPALTAPAPTITMQQLGPKAAHVASLLGSRADAPAVADYVTRVLGKKVPTSTNEQDEEAGVEAPKLGIELQFSHAVLNDRYPPISKSAKALIPYLTYVWVSKAIGESVLGVPWTAASADDVAAVLGPATGKRAEFAGDADENVSYWLRELDTAAHSELEIEFSDRLAVVMRLRAARDLEKFVDVTTGLFVGYAATRGLLDESRFSQHEALLERIKRREAKRSELVSAAMPRRPVGRPSDRRSGSPPAGLPLVSRFRRPVDHQRPGRGFWSSTRSNRTR